MITPKQAYKASVAKGFYNPIPSQAQRLVLIIGELSEAVEAIRADKWLLVENDAVYRAWEADNHEKADRGDAYPELIKGTVEEEIADTYIRVLDYMGYLGVEYKPYIHEVEHLPSDLMEGILQIMTVVLTIPNSNEEEFLLNGTLYLLEIFSKIHNIDLEFHVEQKFLYNQSRPFKHGKSF